MLSFVLIEGIFDPSPFDQLPFPQNFWGRYHTWKDLPGLDEYQKNFGTTPDSTMSKEDTESFYNGVGKQFGYSKQGEIPDDSQSEPPTVFWDDGKFYSPQMFGSPLGKPFNIPDEIGNE